MRRLAAALALAVLGMACGGSGPRGAPPGPEAAGGPRAPERIVTLAPNLTEIAFALDLGDRVVGVSDYATWPPEARERPRLGGLFDPNLERTVALEPDLALLLPSQEAVAAHLERVGVETLVVGVETVADLESAIGAVAGRCGVEAAGRALAAELHRELAPRPVAGAPVTVVAVDRAPGRTEGLLVAGPGNYLHELLGRLGAENAFADAPARYPQVGMEEVLARAPGAVLEIRPGPLPDDLRRRLLADWERFPNLPAVSRGAIHVIAGDGTMIIGPRLPRLYRAMEEALRHAARGPGAPAGSGTP